MPTLSIRTLTAASNKAKVAADERAHFFREQYRRHALGLAGKKNARGWGFTRVEGGNHTSRKALKAALERLAESPTSRDDTDLILIADYAFLKDGMEEERRLVKEGGQEKVAKEEVAREGVGKLLERVGSKFRKVTVLFEKSPEENGSLDQHIQSLQRADQSGDGPVARVLHCHAEVIPEVYARLLWCAAGMAP
jgi:hypothetical protein